MSATPINLNKVRKARARAADKVRADSNAVAFGRTKAEKVADRDETSRHARIVDGAAIETPPHGADGGKKKP